MLASVRLMIPSGSPVWAPVGRRSALYAEFPSCLINSALTFVMTFNHGHGVTDRLLAHTWLKYLLSARLFGFCSELLAKFVRTPAAFRSVSVSNSRLLRCAYR